MPGLPILLFVLAFSLFWCVLMWFISHLCGWAALARHYRAAERFEGRRHHFKSGKIGWSNFSGCLTIGANAKGLYIAPVLFFRIGHPPLFIPWTEIEAESRQMWLIGSKLIIRCEKASSVTIQLHGSLGKRIAEDATKAWETHDVEPERIRK